MPRKQQVLSMRHRSSSRKHCHPEDSIVQLAIAVLLQSFHLCQTPLLRLPDSCRRAGHTAPKSRLFLPRRGHGTSSEWRFRSACFRRRSRDLRWIDSTTPTDEVPIVHEILLHTPLPPSRAFHDASQRQLATETGLSDAT